MVPPAEFRSYYGRPILKQPTWKVPDVPAYLYLGGTAGVSAALADLTGRPGLRRVGRLTAAVGATASVGALIHDLGRPERFLNMPGRVLRAARVVTAVGAVGALAGARPGRPGRWLSAAGGLLLNAAAVATRHGVFDAGRVSAADPAYTVVPQRSRLEDRQQATPAKRPVDAPADRAGR